MNLSELLKNPNFKDQDLRDDLVFYMRSDPVFYRKAYYPAMCELDDAIDSGRKTGPGMLKKMVELAAYNYVKKFGIKETVDDVFTKEDLSEVINHIYNEESEKCRKGDYRPLE